MSADRTRGIFSPHPVIEANQKIIANMKSKTGRSLEEWVEFANANAPIDPEERRAWLKTNEDLGSNYAWFITASCDGRATDLFDPETYLQSAEQWVEAMYTGKRAQLRPIHDRLIELCRELGDDVRICPCQTIIPVYREHVFAKIKPATNSRIDFGLALRDTPAAGRLIDTGGFAKKDRITHKFALSAIDQIDDEVTCWLRTAYERFGSR